MKCPFLITRKDIIDKDGNKTGEDIELQECIKNNCMIYDGATKLCSLLSSNMKTGVLIEDIKKGVGEIKDEVFQRSEAMSVTLSTTVQTLQQALLSRFDILKKQNEVMVLGFDRLVETVNNKFEGLKVNFSELSQTIKAFQESIVEAMGQYSNTVHEKIDGVKQSVSNQTETMAMSTQRLQISLDGIKSAEEQFFGEVKTFNETLLEKINDNDSRRKQISEALYSKLDIVKEGLEKISTTNQAGMEAVSGEIGKAVQNTRDVLTKLERLDTLSASMDSMNAVVKTEMAGLKTETLQVLNNIVTKIDALSGAFAETMKPGIDSVIEFMKTEVTGLKSESLTALMGLGAKLDELAKAFIASSKVQEGAFQSMIADFKAISEGIKGEVAALKTEQGVSLNNVCGTVMQLEALFKQSSESLGSMSGMMENLNKNYIESLGKIAGLAEGMRKGVDKVGEGMQLSVKDLVKEMKSEIGALENQYKKTFSDIAALAGKFDELNIRLREMTKEVEKEFQDSFARQTKLSEYTKTILEHIKEYFVKEEARYKEEQILRKKKEGLDHFDRATLYYYRGTYELAMNEIIKALEIETTAEYLNLKGILLTDLGRFDDSKKAFADALKIEPNFAEIHNNLGLLYLKMKKLDDAIVSFQEAVKKNVNYALAYVNLGKVFIEQEKFDDAIKAYERALEIDPSNHDAREAIDLYKKGKIGE